MNERDLDNPRAGGAEVHLFEVFGRLADRGFPVTLICARHPGASATAIERGIDIRRVGNRYTFYARGPALFRRLARDFTGSAVLVENLCKLPFYGPLYSPFGVLAIVHHLFGTTAFRQVNPAVALATYLSELAIPPVYRGVTMIAVSPSTRDDLIVRGVAGAHVSVIPNAVDHDHYTPGDGVPGPLILSLGRTERYKRIDVVIDAMPRIREVVPNARLLIVGRGEAVSHLRDRARRLDLESAVEFRGFVDEDEKVDLYRSARVFVNSSEKEGWGLTVLEANACGTPAVATDVPGLRDAVRHDRSGLLVPFADVHATADAIIRILRDDDTWRRLRIGALEWAAEFRWDRVTDQVQTVIEQVALAGRGRRHG